MVVVGAIVVLAAIGAGVLIYNIASGSSSVGTWLAKNYARADDATIRAATEREAALGLTVTASGLGASTTTSTVAVPEDPVDPADPSTTLPGTGGTTPGTSVRLSTRPDDMFVATTNVTDTAAALTAKFTPNDTQNREGRVFLEYEEAVVAVVPALTGTGSLIFLDKGDTGYRRWGGYTGAIWGTSRAGRGFSSGGGGGGSRGGGSSGGGK
jgi:hypothetical protein